MRLNFDALALIQKNITKKNTNAVLCNTAQYNQRLMTSAKDF
jgi:hypothetical protein